MPPRVLVRVGGLPIESIRSVSSPRCVEALTEIWSLEEQLDRLRAEAVDELGAAVPGADKPRRRLLLAVRRDCHNGRPLDKHRGSDLWTELVDTGRKVQEILELERRAAEARDTFRSLYDSELNREVGALSSLLDHQRFLHGLSFSSPSMASQLTRLRKKPPERHRRRERRLASSLLRYASRAALKLSPNSTLTRVAWARLDRDLPNTGSSLELPAGPWRHTSTFRFQRAALDQLTALLLTEPSLRRRLEVTLNRSLDRSRDGSVQFVRPAVWLPGREGTMRYRPSAVTRLDAGTPLLSWCMDNLRSASMTFEELTARLVDDVGADLAEEVSALLVQFLDIGVLEWLCPWCVPGRHTEAELATFLTAASADEGNQGTEGTAEALRQLVALERGADLPPARLPRRAMALFERAWNSSVTDDTMHPYETVRPTETGDLDLTETVVLSERGAAAGEPLVSLSTDSAEQALRHLRPWSEMVGLYGHRLDMLMTLSAQLCRAAPSGEGPPSRLPILDAFQLAQPFWLPYRRVVQRHRMGTKGWTEAFNPLELAEIDELATLKRHLFARLLELTDEPDEGPVRLQGPALDELVREIPVDYRAPIGPCLQLQPTDPEARSWVLNRFFEGTGRYSSRYSLSMDDEPRTQFLDHMIERSTVHHRGETHHLLDLMCSKSHELNARHMQTRSVVLLPGEGFHVPAPTGVPLRDLFCEVDDSSRLPRLVGRDGTRFLAVHLGGMALEMMPGIVQFLALFGPGEYLSPRPPIRARVHDDFTVSPRLDLGNITLRRARWSFATDRDRLEQIADSSGAEAFEAVQRLRRAVSLPQRVFLLERVSERAYKPQFLDLSSPHFVEIFRSAVRSQERVTLVEALPDIGDHPRSTDGTAWAMEAQIDARSFAQASQSTDSGAEAVTSSSDS